MRGEARVQRGGERRYYRCPRAGQQIVQLDDGQPAVCHERLVPADAAEKTVLDAISRGVLPAEVIEAARDELRQRLQVPHDSLTGRRRERLKQRMEQLRKQHEWADISDEDYRARRAETLEELALLRHCTPRPRAEKVGRAISAPTCSRSGCHDVADQRSGGRGESSKGGLTRGLRQARGPPPCHRCGLSVTLNGSGGLALAMAAHPPVWPVCILPAAGHSGPVDVT